MNMVRTITEKNKQSTQHLKLNRTINVIANKNTKETHQLKNYAYLSNQLK